MLVPIALAILFSFLLTPIVRLLERTFLRRTGAIVLSLGLTIAGLGFGGWWMYQQFTDVAREISQAAASGHIEEKLKFLRSRTGGTLAVFERTLQRVAEARDKPVKADLNVRVIPERKSIGGRYEEVAPQVEFVAAWFLVIVLVFFLLQDREQLRDKMLRLAGRAHLTVTTQAIGETSERISKYLLTIAMLNIGFGLLIGVGLWLFRVPHAGLWGMVAGLLRFVPYIGAVLSAAFPTFLALAVFPNWYTALAVLGLFIFSDQLIGGFVEPIVVGNRVGVSPIALLVAAIFWGWLWGPVGLLLATPITVCLTVGGEFIPALRIFSIMFGSEDPLEGYLSFYNRLLLRDRTGAIAIADRHAESGDDGGDVHRPLHPDADVRAGRARPQAHHAGARSLHQGRHPRADHPIRRPQRRHAGSGAPHRRRVGRRRAPVARHADAHAAAALESYSVDYFTDLPDPELVAFINEVKPEAVFISCSNPDHVEQGFTLLQLLAANFPDLMIVAGGSGFARDRAKTLAAGATYVPSTLTEAKEDFLTRRKGGKRKATRSITFSGTRFRVPPRRDRALH